MGVLHYLITSALLAIILRWLWKAARTEKAKVESGRQVFPATKPIAFLLILFAFLFAALAVASLLLVHEARNWWVPYLFLGFALLVLLAYPPVLTIEVDGIGSRTWFGKEKKVRWEDVSSLHYNAGNKYFTVRAIDGRKITHSGFNVDPNGFRDEIQKRTRLPMKFAQPGLWKTETIEVPYDQTVPSEQDPD